MVGLLLVTLLWTLCSSLPLEPLVRVNDSIVSEDSTVDIITSDDTDVNLDVDGVHYHIVGSNAREGRTYDKDDASEHDHTDKVIDKVIEIASQGGAGVEVSNYQSNQDVGDEINLDDERGGRGGFVKNTFNLGDIEISGSVHANKISIGSRVNIGNFDHEDMDEDDHDDDHKIIGHNVNLPDIVVSDLGLNAEDNKDLKAAFRYIDDNGDELLSADELFKACQNLDIPITEECTAKMVLSSSDEEDKSGIDYVKFGHLLKYAPSFNKRDLIHYWVHAAGFHHGHDFELDDDVTYRRHLDYVFLILDQDHDGELTPIDLMMSFQDMGDALGETEAEMMFAKHMAGESYGFTFKHWTDFIDQFSDHFHEENLAIHWRRVFRFFAEEGDMTGYHRRHVDSGVRMVVGNEHIVEMLKKLPAVTQCPPIKVEAVEDAWIEVVEGLNYKLKIKIKTRSKIGASCTEEVLKVCDNVVVFKPLPNVCKGVDCLMLQDTEYIKCHEVSPTLERCIDECQLESCQNHRDLSVGCNKMFTCAHGCQMRHLGLDEDACREECIWHGDDCEPVVQGWKFDLCQDCHRHGCSTQVPEECQQGCRFYGTDGLLPPAYPGYLDVLGFNKCLGTNSEGSSSAWCFPFEKPAACSPTSWEKLMTLQKEPSQRLALCVLLPPGYLDVLGFNKCLGTKSVGSSSALCFPFEKPAACSPTSWEKLSTLQKEPSQRLALCVSLPPGYLDVLDFNKCLGTKSEGSSSALCFPFEKPAACSPTSWEKLMILQKEPTQRLASCVSLPPGYLDVLDFNECLGTQSEGLSSAWCFPFEKPAACSPTSWEKLMILQKEPTQRLASCVPHLSNPDAVEEVADANRMFACALYNTVKTQMQALDENLLAMVSPDQVENWLLSPFSASSVMAMAYMGAEGETFQQMMDGMYFPEKNTLAAGYKDVFRVLKGNHHFNLVTANKLFVHNGFELLDGFKATMMEYFNSEVKQVDFSKAEEAPKEINDWVKRQTNNKIEELISEDFFTSYMKNAMNDDAFVNALLNGNTEEIAKEMAFLSPNKAVLVNAIYFKGDWVHQFAEEYTREEDFYATDGEPVKVMMMHNRLSAFKMCECKGKNLQARTIELPYEGDRISMYIVLPNEKDGLDEVETLLCEKTLKEELIRVEEKEKRQISLYLPKFKMEKTIQLSSNLKALRMTDMFSSKADFSGINGKKDIAVMDVVQKTFLEVDEFGSEAAAASAVTMGLTSSPDTLTLPEFKCDHPFLFFIYDKFTNMMLFRGRVVYPTLQSPNDIDIPPFVFVGK